MQILRIKFTKDKVLLILKIIRKYKTQWKSDIYSQIVWNKKLGINLNPTTFNRIIQTFRKQGKIQPTGSWKKFLKSHWDSLFGMDFVTIDTLFGKRFYLLIILELKSRRTVQWNLWTYQKGANFRRIAPQLLPEQSMKVENYSTP